MGFYGRRLGRLQELQLADQSASDSPVCQSSQFMGEARCDREDIYKAFEGDPGLMMMRMPMLLALQAVWVALGRTMQHYPSAWGHYDVCKSQVYTDDGLTWDFMACQPEATDMTKYLKVTLDPPNITCGDPPETYCALGPLTGSDKSAGVKWISDSTSAGIVDLNVHIRHLDKGLSFVDAHVWFDLRHILPIAVRFTSSMRNVQVGKRGRYAELLVGHCRRFGQTREPNIYVTPENPYMCNNECDASTVELAHPPSLMFDSEGRNPTTFWQSTSWKKYPKPLQVNITLSWNKTIELTDDIVITFESGRPEQMVLEKSLDYGRTWQPYQFYATDCLDAFTMEPKRVNELTQHTLLNIICTEDYSRGYVWKYDKMVRFEIKDRFALFAGPRLHNMASLYGQLDTTKNLRDFFTITDLRIRLLRPATGTTMVDENNLSRYFYAISDIKVQGSFIPGYAKELKIVDEGSGPGGAGMAQATPGLREAPMHCHPGNAMSLHSLNMPG
ncbi:netrin-G1-like [Scleropages formosus]|uniref:Netrin-G1-like n=1 Tax=Scleropages formosus TaxID=113540 RepID=A0A0P7V104_SCLFO|nr:netrin-G1-like [Scleropages formosus]